MKKTIITNHKMKHLLFLPFESGFNVPNRVFVTLENAQILANEGHEVILLYCDGNPMNMCWINTCCDIKMCKMCNCFRKQMFKSLSEKITLMSISVFFQKTIADYSDFSFEYNSIEDIKKLTYNNVGIGYAALSSYITPTRNLYPLMDETFRKYFDSLLRCTIITTDIVNAALDFLQPDVVSVFNSRFTVSKPVFDTCQHRKVDVIIYETTGNAVNDRQLAYYKNRTPQNPEGNTENLYKMWTESAKSCEEKINIGVKFFTDRRGAIPAGDKVYVGNQQEGLLPEKWDGKKHNIVIFNSSEDEYVSLGEEFDHNMFPSQFQGIKTIFERYKDEKDYHFYLRIHPNLKDVKYAYHKKLFELADISDNITIIPGDSPISTYALMDAAEKVIVFGSTTGQEAVYWGKPVISLALCDYSLLDICYSPTTIEELDELIYADLQPKDKMPAIQMAFFRMNGERPDFKYFKYVIVHKSIAGHQFDLYKWETKGHWWTKFVCTLLQLVGGAYRQKKYPRPNKEDLNATL